VAVEESNSEQAEWAKNSLGTDAATSTREERGLDREDEVFLRADTGLGSMAGNHDSSAACCRQGC